MSRPIRTLADFADWARRSPALAGGLAFAGPEAEYGIGLERWLPRYGIACIDASPATAILAQRGVDLCVLDGATAAIAPERRPDAPPLPAPSSEAADTSDAADTSEDADGERGHSTLSLLADARFARWLDTLAGGGQPNILVFKSSYQLEQQCEARGWRLLAPRAGLARRWENKVAFRSIAEGLGLPQAPGLIFDPARERYANLSDRLGRRFVVQAPHGYSGARTWLVDDDEALARALDGLRARRLRATAFVEGLPLTLTACVTAQGVAVSSPFCQVTGTANLTRHALGSCGNDWSTARGLGLEKPRFNRIAERIGTALAEEGYRGVFGIDFVLPPSGEPVVIEVNPRLVASIALHAQLELAEGRLPLLARHLLAHLEPEADGAPLDLHQADLEGGQVILHNLAAGPRRARGGLQTGAHADPGALPGTGYLRPALRVDELGANETLLLAPSTDRWFGSGQAWGRLQGRTSVMATDGALRPELSRWVDHLQARAGMQDPSLTESSGGDSVDA
ncbi:MAG: ATP-grasp domain-containing protein [Caldilineae bacterium]|nr:ATP-grasp domain-containing protein [Chloroflexota bacterium]MCB9175562.1 ATP-grasp domain-containing protein [Caldilineae bacterium]